MAELLRKGHKLESRDLKSESCDLDADALTSEVSRYQYALMYTYLLRRRGGRGGEEGEKEEEGEEEEKGEDPSI